MRAEIAAAVVLAVPLVAGCTLLGPGSHYDTTVATEAVGQVLAPGTPASHAEIFLQLVDAGAERPIPPNRTHDAGRGSPGAELAIPANMSKAIWRLPLDADGEVTVRVPVDRDVDATFRIVESEPPFHVSERECPEPQRLRSSLKEVHLEADATFDLPYFVACGQG